MVAHEGDEPHGAQFLTFEAIAAPRHLHQALLVAASFGLKELEESAPISFIGTGMDLNAATDNGLQRAAAVLNMSIAEVRNRATITGAITIGRHPGVIQVTFLAPLENLKRCGLLPLARDQYRELQG